MPEETKGSVGEGGANLTGGSAPAGSQPVGTPAGTASDGSLDEDKKWFDSLPPDKKKEIRNLTQLYGKQAEELGTYRQSMEALAPHWDEIEKIISQPRKTNLPNSVRGFDPQRRREQLESMRVNMGDEWVDGELALLDTLESERRIVRNIANKQFAQEHPDYSELSQDVDQFERDIASGKFTLRELSYNMAKLMKKVPEMVKQAREEGKKEALQPKVSPTLGGTGGELGGTTTPQPDELGRTPEELAMLDEATKQNERSKEVLNLLK